MFFSSGFGDGGGGQMPLLVATPPALFFAYPFVGVIV
jgi:hypothetical protein